MDFYFGIDLLQQLRQYYEGRLSLAACKSFDQQDAKYSHGFLRNWSVG